MSALALALTLAQAAPASAEVRWEVVHDTPEGTLSIDPASISRSGDTMRMRRRTEYRQTGPDGMRSLVFTVDVRCSARTYSILRMEGYREDGSLIRGIDFGPDEETVRDRAFPAADEAEALFGRSCRGTAR